jgi:hypothetical protein
MKPSLPLVPAFLLIVASFRAVHRWGDCLFQGAVAPEAMKSFSMRSNRNRLVALVLVVVVILASQSLAAEISGTVRSTTGEYTTVKSNSNSMPRPRDKAQIFFKIAGLDEEISVAEGYVYEITGANIMVKIEKATGTVEQGQLVRFTSNATTGTTPEVKPTSSPEPAMETIADLARDYRPGTTGLTSTSVSLRGTVAGSWHFFQDNDLSTSNGNAGGLVWKSNPKYFNSKSGYAGTETDFGMSFPIVSAERLLDGAAPAPPAGSLMGHPSARKYLAIQYRLEKTESVENTAIQYRFEKPNLFHQDEVHIIKNAGGIEQVLFSKKDLGAGGANQVATGTISGIGRLGPGDSVWIMLGAAGDAAGDQTWLQVTLTGNR